MLWVTLELNMLRFLPIMSSEGGLALENTIKYFLVQRWASIVFLIGFFFSIIFWNTIIYICLIGILLKLGASPLHGWFVSIIKTCSLWVLVLLSRVQKIIPLLIMSNFFIRLYIFIFFSIRTFFIVIISLPGSINLNKILALSSMSNLIWFLVCTQLNIKLLTIFISIYILLLVGVLLMYNKNIYRLFIQINRIVFIDKIMIIFVFISLGGLPPLLGFLGKLLVLKNILVYINIVFLFSLIYTSLIVLYHYLSRIFFLITYTPILKYSNKIVTLRWKKIIYILSVISFNLFIILPF